MFFRTVIVKWYSINVLLLFYSFPKTASIVSSTAPSSSVARYVSASTTVETSTTKYKDTTIYVPQSTVVADINYDSLMNVLQAYAKQGLEPKIIYKTEKESPTNLILKLDQNGRLQADCSTNEQVIKLLIKENERLRVTTNTVVVKEIPQWIKILIGVETALLLLAALIIWFKTMTIF